MYVCGESLHSVPHSTIQKGIKCKVKSISLHPHGAATPTLWCWKRKVLSNMAFIKSVQKYKCAQIRGLPIFTYCSDWFEIFLLN